MSDLISREKAMMEARPEYLNPNQKGHEEYNKAWNDGVKAYWNGLKELPSELEWIPCSERLPEMLGKYLVTRKWKDNSGEEHITVITSWYRKYDVIGLDWSDFDVVAWQPLPKPYKEQTERSE